MEKLELEKKLLIGAYLISLIISYTRFTLIYESIEVNDDSFTSPFAFMIYIDIILNTIAQSILLISFYNSYKFFRDQYVHTAGLKAIPCKLKFLTGWIIFLILLTILDFIFRIFSRILSIKGVENLYNDWAEEIWVSSLGFLFPFTKFCEILTYSIMIIAMCKSTIVLAKDDD